MQISFPKTSLNNHTQEPLIKPNMLVKTLPHLDWIIVATTTVLDGCRVW